MPILFTADGLVDLTFEVHHAEARSLIKLLDSRPGSDGTGTLNPEDVMKRMEPAVREVAAWPSGMCRAYVLEKLSDLEMLAEVSWYAGLSIRYS